MSPGLLATGLALLVAGCQSFSSNTGYLASIKIENRPQADIEGATAAVFSAHGFAGTSTGPGMFTFRRPGTKADDLLYGDFLDQAVEVKVEVTITPVTDTTTVVGCNAQIVQNPDDPSFSQARRVNGLHAGPYQRMLDEIPGKLP